MHSGGTDFRRRIPSFRRIRRAAAGPLARFDAFLPGRPTTSRPIHRQQSFRPASRGAAPARTAVRHASRRTRRKRSSISGLSDPAHLGRRGVDDGRTGHDPRTDGHRGRCAEIRLFAQQTAAPLPRVGFFFGPQLPDGCQIFGHGRMAARLELLGRPRPAHGPRPPCSRSLYQCPDPGLALREAFRRKPPACVHGDRTAFDAGNASLLDRRSLHAHGRSALQPRVGIPERQSAQFARETRGRTMGRSCISWHRVARHGSCSLMEHAGRRAEIQLAGLVRRPYAHARQLPLSPLVHGRQRNRAGMAVERPALHADRLGRLDRHQPHGRRPSRLCTRRPDRTALRHAGQRDLYLPPRSASDARLRSPCPTHIDPQLQTDARSAGCALCDRHRPISGGRRHLRQPA